MNAHVHAFSLIADHLQGTCDYMGTCIQNVGGPALQGEGQRKTNRAITHSLCLSASSVKWA